MFSQETSPLGGPYGNMRGPGMGGPPSARTGYDSFSYGNQVIEVCRCEVCCADRQGSLPIVVVFFCFVSGCVCLTERTIFDP